MSIPADKITEDLIRKLPKTDLHLHLDGSLRIETLIDLAKKYDVKLPAYTVEGLKKEVFRETYSDLVEYLQGFGYVTAVLQNPESMERVSYELAQDNFLYDGVKYFEVRFCPQLNANIEMDICTVLRSVNKGLKRCRDEINATLNEDEEPLCDYGIIITAMRAFDGNFSQYFKALTRVHEFAPPSDIQALASMELCRAGVFLRDNENIPIVGLDIAGAEAGFPAEIHEGTFRYAHRNFMGKSVHAGEAYGPESIFQAVSKLFAERIGHGFHLFDWEMVKDEKDPKKYVEDLANFMADRRIVIEVCLSSNLQTIPDLRDHELKLSNHTFSKMLEHNLAVTLCTDNRTVSLTNMTREVQLAVSHFGLDSDKLKEILMTGFEKSFMHTPYAKKRAYLASVSKYYDRIIKEHIANNQ